MNYQSTRDSRVSLPSAAAIARGISADGGLFVPCEIPQVNLAWLRRLAPLSYTDRAREVLRLYLTDYTDDELTACVTGAYRGRFDRDEPAPLVPLDGQAAVLELWHGPTCAFKDMALQLLPHLLTRAAQKTGGAATTVILVATSGDTGKAALEGFQDVPGTRMVVFYPRDGVSDMQKRQMTTQSGGNVAVFGVEGNFDDAQTGVKRLFGDPALAARLQAADMAFSSANSINWGRLVPQIVYYISAYVDMVAAGRVAWGDPVNVVVPTGNFGNILAGYYARCMGVPIARFLCASNANRVLTDFLQTGVYDRARPFHTTLSPSMDILISSNLERLLYHLTGRDDARVRDWMEQLKTAGRYDVGADLLRDLQRAFAAASVDDEKTRRVICRTFRQKGYLCDTHTAVALGAYEQYTAQTGDKTPTVIVSTASPYKFAPSVLSALDPAAAEGEDFDLLQRLSEMTGTPVPAPLAALKGKPVRFTQVCPPSEMEQAVLSALGL